MDKGQSTDEPPAMHEALDWVIRLTSGSATQADARAFEAWREQSPQHAPAFQDAVALRATLRAMPLSARSPEPARNNVVSFIRPAAFNRRAVLTGGAGAMAASAAVLTISPPFGLWPSLAEMNAGERTGVGERRTIRPMAGVTLDINARSAVSLSSGGGAAELVAGEAFVSVAQAARAMLIHAGGETWAVQDADINVRTSAEETCIACVKGEAKRADGSLTLAAGQRYVAATGAAPRVMPFAVALSGTWRKGILLFRNTALSEAVEAINRYRSGKIILANQRVGSRLISGMFHTDQIENAATQVQQLLNLEMTKLPGGVVLFS